MTFSIVKHEIGRGKKVVGTLWARDEAGARDIAPSLFGSGNCGELNIERSDDREIPFRLYDSESRLPGNF